MTKVEVIYHGSNRWRAVQSARKKRAKLAMISYFGVLLLALNFHTSSYNVVKHGNHTQLFQIHQSLEGHPNRYFTLKVVSKK